MRKYLYQNNCNIYLIFKLVQKHCLLTRSFRILQVQTENREYFKVIPLLDNIFFAL